MSGKFMRSVRIVIPTLTAIVIASQLMGCSATSKDEASSILDNNSSSITLEVPQKASDTSKNPGVPSSGAATSGGIQLEQTSAVKIEKLQWVPLGMATSYAAVRSSMDSLFETKFVDTDRVGCLYLDINGNQCGNNTLYNALHNQKVQQIISGEGYSDFISESVSSGFTDLDTYDYLPASLCCYFDLLPSDNAGEFGGTTPLTRAQAMTLITRATTPVESSRTPKSDPNFTNAVGQSKYTDYAGYVNSLSYISTNDGSLNESTFNESMTRAEYIYLIMNIICGSDEINNVDTSSTNISDCVDNKISDGKHSDLLSTSLANAATGLPTDIFKSLVKAEQLGILSTETEWDSPITKSDAIVMFTDAVIAHTKQTNTTVTKTEGSPEEAREQYKKEAVKSFKSHKDETSLDKTTYVKKFIVLRTKGMDAPGAEQTLLSRYPKIEEAPQEETQTDTSSENNNWEQVDNGTTNNNNGGDNGNNQQYYDPSTDNGGNSGGNDNYTPPVDNGGSNNGGNDNYTPPVDNGGNSGGNDNYTPPVDNGNSGGNDNYTPPVDNGGGNSGNNGVYTPDPNYVDDYQVPDDMPPGSDDIDWH